MPSPLHKSLWGLPDIPYESGYDSSRGYQPHYEPPADSAPIIRADMRGTQHSLEIVHPERVSANHESGPHSKLREHIKFRSASQTSVSPSGSERYYTNANAPISFRLLLNTLEHQKRICYGKAKEAVFRLTTRDPTKATCRIVITPRLRDALTET
ncbi:unnamed protein product [Rhizoctonia solani]|uniref:Uncharacterized protein n=1 Tax=Rhizoctonia solani TaxID=456999 RepID=A0A8H3B8Y8_9AGAM|nr:unnamed protein product [Rhizoctonia solani]